MKKIVGRTRALFPLTLFTSPLLRVKCHVERSRFNHFKYFESRKELRTMSIPQDARFLFGSARCCTCFRKLLPGKMLKVILLKDRKFSLVSVFCC